MSIYKNERIAKYLRTIKTYCVMDNEGYRKRIADLAINKEDLTQQDLDAVLDEMYNKEWYDQIICDMDLNDEEIESIVCNNNYLHVKKIKDIFLNGKNNSITTTGKVRENILVMMTSDSLKYNRTTTPLKTDTPNKRQIEDFTIEIKKDNESASVNASFHTGMAVSNPNTRRIKRVDHIVYITDTYKNGFITSRKTQNIQEVENPGVNIKPYNWKIEQSFEPLEENRIWKKRTIACNGNSNTKNFIHDNLDTTGKTMILSKNCLAEEHALGFITQNILSRKS